MHSFGLCWLCRALSGQGLSGRHRIKGQVLPHFLIEVCCGTRPRQQASLVLVPHSVRQLGVPGPCGARRHPCTHATLRAQQQARGRDSTSCLGATGRTPRIRCVLYQQLLPATELRLPHGGAPGYHWNSGGADIQLKTLLPQTPMCGAP